MPPNLINIVTNNTSNDVWHKLHPFRSRLAQFVYGSCLFQSPSELAAKLYILCGVQASHILGEEVKPFLQSKEA